VLGRTLERAGWPIDDRPFRPHLTLARSDGLVAGSLVASQLAAALGDTTVAFPLERIVLFESRSGDGPPRYIEVADGPLGIDAPIRPGVSHDSD
jgi:2'-5' RNA ligase